jgi:hypothetical protein
MTKHHENKILLLLGRLEGKVDSLLKVQAQLEEKLLKADQRIRSLERCQSYWAGAAAFLGALVGFVTNFLHRS